MSKIVLAIILLIAFTIGLNIGLHGSILFGDWGNPSGTSADGSQAQQQTNVDNHYVKASTNTPPQHRISPPQQPIQPSLLVSKTENGKSESAPLTAQITSSEDTESLASKLKAIDDKVNQFIEEKKITTSRSNIYGNIPILLLTCNRFQLLDETLKSLANVRGVKTENILIIQDGNMVQIADVANQHQIRLIKNTAGLRLRGGAGDDGASRIAKHYKFALTTAFDQYPEAPAIVIVEDDLLFSPDFYEYLTTVAPVLDDDPTTFVVSAWNDNGFKKKVNDPYALRRTEFFPGLGWLLTRKLYKGELEAKWPNEHWDHWLRSEETHRNRETIHPQVPRTYHNGIRGTFMNEATHNKYFKDIAYNQDPAVHWSADATTEGTVAMHASVLAKPYEYRIEELIRTCHHATSVRDMLQQQDSIVCVWIDIPINIDNYPPFERVSTFFGIWHEFKRDNHHGLHEFYFESNYILLINIFHVPYIPTSGAYKNLKPSHVVPIPREQFDRSALDVIKSNAPPQKIQSTVVKASALNLDCNEVCSAQGKTCHAEELESINNCNQLQANFPCTMCIRSLGAEQPAYVAEDAPLDLFPGHCLFNYEVNLVPITCSAKHPYTYRLCPCM